MQRFTHCARTSKQFGSHTLDAFTEAGVAIINAATVEEIYKEKENMIRAFCREIQSHKQHQYSNLVLSVIHYIEHQYAEDLSIQQIADELNANINHLTAVFRQETGVTPSTYIRQTRMKQAVQLLVSTDLSVQDISNGERIKQFAQETRIPKCERRCPIAIPPQ